MVGRINDHYQSCFLLSYSSYISIWSPELCNSKCRCRIWRCIGYSRRKVWRRWGTARTGEVAGMLRSVAWIQAVLLMSLIWMKRVAVSQVLPQWPLPWARAVIPERIILGVGRTQTSLSCLVLVSSCRKCEIGLGLSLRIGNNRNYLCFTCSLNYYPALLVLSICELLSKGDGNNDPNNA